MVVIHLGLRKKAHGDSSVTRVTMSSLSGYRIRAYLMPLEQVRRYLSGLHPMPVGRSGPMAVKKT